MEDRVNLPVSMCMCLCDRDSVCYCMCVRERERDCVCVRVCAPITGLNGLQRVGGGDWL